MLCLFEKTIRMDRLTQKKYSFIEDVATFYLGSSHQSPFCELTQIRHGRLRMENNPTHEISKQLHTLSLKEFTTRERETCEPTATRDLIMFSIISTCLLTSGGKVSLATHQTIILRKHTHNARLGSR